MLTLRCTAKMLKHLGVKPDSDPAKSDTMLGNWFGNVFTVNMREYFIFTSSRALISIVTEASDQLPLCEFIPKLQQLLSQYGVPQKQIDAELQAINQISFGKTDNRSVIGSMNDLINTLKFLCDPQGRGCDPTSPDVHYSL